MDKNALHAIEPTHTGINRCLNFYCIYEKDAYCRLPAISLNEQGVCRQCQMLLPEQDEAILQYRKDQAQKR